MNNFCINLYQAPLEGITTYIYRNALADIFGNIDKYFAPFISPYEKRIITDKEKRQLDPEHNNKISLVPQILTMDSKGFLELTDWLHKMYGYREFNLNLGCPSGTVVSKGRGSGALKDLDALKCFLDRITDSFKYELSVKTRIGYYDTDEFEELLSLYNQYELKELIIHPRTRVELYKGLPHTDIYKWACLHSRNKLIYNGNIDSPESINRLSLTDTNSQFDGTPTEGIMIGRAMIANPSIFREIKGGKPADRQELSEFLNRIQNEYLLIFDGEVNVLHKLKEIWAYMGPYLTDKYACDERVLKKLLKSRRLSEYNIYVREMLSQIG